MWRYGVLLTESEGHRQLPGSGHAASIFYECQVQRVLLKRTRDIQSSPGDLFQRRRVVMPKNIVICCDGTGNEFGGRNSNVIKLYKTLACDAGQVAYYHPGVGTMGARSALTPIGKWWTKLIGLAFGYGVSDNI